MNRLGVGCVTLLLLMSQSAWAVFHASPLFSRISRQWTVQDGSSLAAQYVYGNSVATDSAGNSYVLGNSDAPFHGHAKVSNTDFIVAKYDSSGSLQWSVQDGSPPDDPLHSPSGFLSLAGIGVDGAGNVYIAGNTGAANGSLDGVSPSGDYAFFIIKYDSSGTRLWTKFHSVTGGLVIVSALRVDTTGRISLVGVTNTSLDGQVLHGTQDYFVSQFDSSGNLLWTVQDGVVGLSTSGDSIAIDSSGNVYVCGTGKGLDGQASHGTKDFFVSEYDANGNLLWTMEDGGLTSWAYVEQPTIAVDSAGMIYVSGSINDVLDGQALHGITDLFIQKYNPSTLIKEWTVMKGQSANGRVYNAAITVDPSVGDVYVAGITDTSMDGQTLGGDFGLVLTKYNSSGSLQWTVLKGVSGTTADYRVGGIVLDNSNNIVVVGSTNVPLDGNSMLGAMDLFLTQYSSGGVRQWTIQDGGSAAGGVVYGKIAVDSSGNVFVAGSTTSPLDGQTMHGPQDIFISKYSPSGALLWTVQDGGPEGYSGVQGLVVDSTGDVIAVGSTQGALSGQTLHGVEDIFITKYDPSGARLWTVEDGTANAFAGLSSVALDSSGNLYVAGYSTDSLEGGVASGGYDFIVAKYNSSGALQWIHQEGNGGYSSAEAIAVDYAGNIYIAGETDVAMDGGSLQGMTDLVIASYDNGGSKQWLVEDGNGSADVYAYGIVVDTNANVYVLANTNSDSIDGYSVIGDQDYILTKYSTGGSRLWTIDNGIATGESVTARGLALDSTGNVYIVGESDGALDNQVLRGDSDLFISKYNAGGTRLWTYQHGRDGAYISGDNIFVDSAKQIYISGGVDAFGSIGLDGQTQRGRHDYFFSKY